MSRKRREIFNEINITPLTDIFLVLLIIMMVIAPMLDSKGLKMAVPSTAPAQDQQANPKTLSLEITASGEYMVDHQPVPAAALQQRLFQSKAKYPDGLMIVTAPDTMHGAVVKAMDAARSAGIEKIAVSQSE